MGNYKDQDSLKEFTQLLNSETPKKSVFPKTNDQNKASPSFLSNRPIQPISPTKFNGSPTIDKILQEDQDDKADSESSLDESFAHKLE